MTLIQILTDYTNYDWRETDIPLGYEWWEDDTSLGVYAWEDEDLSKGSIVIRNAKGGAGIVISALEYDLLPIAVHYAQFAEEGGLGGPGSYEQFRAFAEAFECLGGEPDFMADREGIHAFVGEPGVYCQWDGERYTIFDHGYEYFASTKEGLKRAYDKLQKQVVALHFLLDEQAKEKIES